MIIITTLVIPPGGDAGPFDLYSDADGYTVPFATNVSVLQLEAGYSSTVPDNATSIKVVSVGICTNFIILDIDLIPTTTTTSSSTSTSTSTSTTSTSTTSTSTSTTTTTTTVAPTPFRCIRLDGCDGLGYRDVAYNVLHENVGDVFQYFIGVAPEVFHCGTVVNNNVISFPDSTILFDTPINCGNATYCEIPNPYPPID